MDSNQSLRKLSRRDVFRVMGVTVAAAAGGHLLVTYAPWLDYEGQTGDERRPYEDNTSGLAQRREMVRYATLGANGHNTQPWKFAIEEDAIEIRPDYGRRLPVVDPHDRELWISLGCALENLLVCARAVGYVPEVTYPDAAEVIRVRLEPDTPLSSPLFDAIPVRQSTRSDYDGRSLPADQLDQLQSIAPEPGVTLKFITGPAEMESVVEYVNQGNLIQYADKQFLDELIRWLRFNKQEAMASLDGLYSVCSGNPNVPGWLGRMFVAGTKPEQQASLDAQRLRSSAGAVAIASETEDRSAWVRSGQVYERLALQMTALDIQSAFLNQPIEVAELRGQFQSALGLGSSQPQLLVRFGHAAPMPMSARRPVDDVLSESGGE